MLGLAVKTKQRHKMASSYAKHDNDSNCIHTLVNGLKV